MKRFVIMANDFPVMVAHRSSTQEQVFTLCRKLQAENETNKGIREQMKTDSQLFDRVHYHCHQVPEVEA
jgi:hypothetical protein